MKSNKVFLLFIIVIVVLFVLWSQGYFNCKDNYGQFPGIRPYVGVAGPDYGDPVGQFLQQVEEMKKEYREKADKLGCGGICRETNDQVCAECIEAQTKKLQENKEEWCSSCQ